MGNIKVENNQSECIKTQNQITGYKYVNICSGQTTFVPYGSGDWLGISILVVVLVLSGLFMKKLMNN